MRKEVVFVIVAAVSAAAHLALGVTFPLLDWDIAQASLAKPPISDGSFVLGWGQPVLPQAFLHGLMAGLFAMTSRFPLLTSHIIISCLFSGATVFLLMFLSWRISGGVASSLVVGILFSLARSTGAINRAGENDLTAGPVLLLALFLLHPSGGRPFLQRRWGRAALALLFALLPFFHIQLSIIAALFMLLQAGLEWTEKRSLRGSFEIVLIAGLFVLGLGMFLGPAVGYSIFSTGLLQAVFGWNARLAGEIAVSRDFSFFASLDWGTHISWFIHALRTQLFGGWFHEDRVVGFGLALLLFFGPWVAVFWIDGRVGKRLLRIAAGVALLWALVMIAKPVPGWGTDLVLGVNMSVYGFCLIFWILPLLSFLLNRPTGTLGAYHAGLLLLQLAWFVYSFCYETLSAERWVPVVVVAAWHNALILKWPRAGFVPWRWKSVAVTIGVTAALLLNQVVNVWQVSKLSGVLSVAGLVLLAGQIIPALRREASGWGLDFVPERFAFLESAMIGFFLIQVAIHPQGIRAEMRSDERITFSRGLLDCGLPGGSTIVHSDFVLGTSIAYFSDAKGFDCSSDGFQLPLSVGGSDCFYVLESCIDFVEQEGGDKTFSFRPIPACSTSNYRLLQAASN